ncbi:MAG: tRNA 2-thiouridine(34) synthase MnmA, partial [Gammaproteobacteria bacterium]|nr:tRNA 2-thiouridine(34) synthase MnmA [Gammaproteobacteria bacterium]
REIGDGRQLLKGADPDKDQSYFLYVLDQYALTRSLFPLGELAKADVRTTAQSLGLATHDKKDSTGICFIGERKFKTFLSRYLRPCPGEIHDLEGNRIGKHDGLMYYTVGQRQGLGIGGPGGPWYVAEKNTASNLLYAVQGHDHPALFAHAALVRDLHWIAGNAGNSSQCQAKIRYRQPDQACRIHITGSRARVVFDQPQRAITPGQSMVFYDGEICLGGGVIETAIDRPASAAA